jgi:hypothetical protein
VNGVVTDLPEAEHAFNLGQEKWQFQRKIGMLVACLNELQELLPNQITAARWRVRNAALFDGPLRIGRSIADESLSLMLPFVTALEPACCHARIKRP